jgi:hypothetical protein
MDTGKEAAGQLIHRIKIVSLPATMPPWFICLGIQIEIIPLFG